ncbi:MAG: hypothetical protein KDA41_07520, partial [Planctomycetales bacterium]|nr:hypothetical protein [Planctomycetales bacterium]
TTFLGALDAAPRGALQRWWFTPNYECLRVADDRSAVELVGEGVQLQSEDKAIGPDGALLNPKAPPNKASDLFAASFTEKYPQIAAGNPVFGQMRNCIDMLVAAAFMQCNDFYRAADWRPASFLDEAAIAVETQPAPQKAPSAANSLWKGNRLFTPAGGGVSILPAQALAPERLLKDDGSLGPLRKQATGRLPADRWWWE